MAILTKASTVRTRASKINKGDGYLTEIAAAIAEAADEGDFQTLGYAPDSEQAYVRDALLAAGYELLPYYNYKYEGAFGCCFEDAAPSGFWAKFLNLFGTKTPDYVVASDPVPEIAPNHFIVSWAKAPDTTQKA